MKVCCNPRGVPHKKRQFGVQLVTSSKVEYYKELIPSFNWTTDNYLCLSCRSILKKQIKEVEGSRQVTRLSSQSFSAKRWLARTIPALDSSSSDFVSTTSSLETEPEAGPVDQSQMPNNSISELDTISSRSQSDLDPDSDGMSTTSCSINLQHVEATADLNRTLEWNKITPVRPSDDKNPTIVGRIYGRVKSGIRSKFDKFTSGEINPSPDTGKSQKPCKWCETLYDELSSKYKQTGSKIEKYKILTSIPKRYSITNIIERLKITTHMGRAVSRLRDSEGAFSYPNYNLGRPLNQEIVSMVVNFYLSNDNSRPSPRSDDVVWIKNMNGQKERVAKRRILFNLNDLYNGFREKHNKVTISCSKFATLRPTNCVWPGQRGFHVTCVCETHQNFEFMLEALGIDVTLDQFIQKVVCETARTDCFFGLCPDCPNMDYILSCYCNINDQKQIEFLQWIHTDSTDLKHTVLSNEEFVEEFERAVIKLVTHDYVFKQQRDYLNRVKEEGLRNTNSLLMNVDFAQNYTFYG